MGSNEFPFLTGKKGIASAPNGKVQCDHVLKQPTIITKEGLI